jgi:hypothetical protein
MNAGALDLTRLPRFPCQVENKKPLTPHGFKDAVRVRDDTAWPLVGVPTGVKFDVLDVDPRNGGTAWYDANFDALPLTRCHQTQGGGIHLLFRPAPGLRCTSDRIAPGIDVKAAGGYVIWWPREGLPFEDAPLCEWPDWLLAEAMKPKARSAVGRNPNTLPLPHHAADLTDALRKLDPRDWSEHDRWLQLMTACRAVGIERADFIEWSVGDPDYADDGEVIARRWDSLAPKHGGALWAALAQSGIKLTHARSAGAGKSVGVPSEASSPSFNPKPTRNLVRRLEAIQRTVERAQGANRERALFNGACTCAEIIAEPGSKLTPSTAKALLLSAAHTNGLLREIGKEEVHRTIANGLRWVEEKLLAQPEKGN